MHLLLLLGMIANTSFKLSYQYPSLDNSLCNKNPSLCYQITMWNSIQARLPRATPKRRSFLATALFCVIVIIIFSMNYTDSLDKVSKDIVTNHVEGELPVQHEALTSKELDSLLFQIVNIKKDKDYQAEVEKEEGGSDEDAAEKLKEKETEQLKKNSKLRESRFSQLDEFLAKYKSQTEIKLNLKDYKASELKNINVTKGNRPFQDLMSKFFDAITAFPQQNKHKERLNLKDGKPEIPNVRYIEHVNVINEDEIGKYLHFDDAFVDELFKKHAHVVSKIPDKAPVDFYNGDGYIMVGGGKYSWYALLVIQTLRERGAVLPVEVFIPNESEYEKEICEKIFPQYDASCIIMPNVYGKKSYAKLGDNLNGYQYKALAYLASSFKNAFLLDADCLPLDNLDTIFTSELFQESKMITWPDFWRRTASPYFYNAAGIQVKKSKARHLSDIFTPLKSIDSTPIDDLSKISFHDREGTTPEWSNETGMLLIDKEFHFNTLLLALFYNYDGPTGFYPLLSQGGAGEGDKETFSAASNYYKKPFYQVLKHADKVWGYLNTEDFYDFTTIVQYDPITDFNVLMKNVYRIQESIKERGDEYIYNYVLDFIYPFNDKTSKPLFYHVHAPKFDPFKMISEGNIFDDNKEDPKRTRILGKDFRNIGFDIELRVWQLMQKNLCVDKIKFDTFKRKDMQEFCEKDIVEHLKFLEETHAEIIEGNVKVDENPVDPEVVKVTELINTLQMSKTEEQAVKNYIFDRMKQNAETN